MLAYGWLSGCGSHEAEENLIMRRVEQGSHGVRALGTAREFL